MSLTQILGYTEQVPNWAPNERFLPNADYGRVGALKLAKNIFEDRIKEYVRAVDTDWGRCGAYHFYLLGKNFAKRNNENIRVSLNRPPQWTDFKFGDFELGTEIQGPYYFNIVLNEITEAARVYGFNAQTLVSAILTLMDGEMINVPLNAVSRTSKFSSRGFAMAELNFGLIESLWGIRSSGFPQTYRKTPGGGFAARGDYGGGKGKRGKRGKKRRYY